MMWVRMPVCLECVSEMIEKRERENQNRTKVSSALWLLLLLRCARFSFTIDRGFLTFKMTESFPVSSNTIRFTTLDLSLLFFFLKNFSSFSAGTSSSESEFDERWRDWEKKSTYNRQVMSYDRFDSIHVFDIWTHTREDISWISKICDRFRATCSVSLDIEVDSWFLLSVLFLYNRCSWGWDFVGYGDSLSLSLSLSLL